MTRVIEITAVCPECGNENNISVEASITTWLYPDLIQKILANGYFFICLNCNLKVFIETDILINTRKGMFYLNTNLPLAEQKGLLVKYGVIDENDTILDQTIPTDSSEIKNDPEIEKILPGIKNAIESLKNDLLNKEK